jgi:hypothetical protein
MPEVDPTDDSLSRITLWHYVYDPERRERRHIDVATYDNERDFLAELERRQHDLAERRRQGTADPLEHFSGLLKPPGYEARRMLVPGDARLGAHRSASGPVPLAARVLAGGRRGAPSVCTRLARRT